MNDRWNGVDYVTIPVKLIDGRWELLYGGSAGIREGAFGELRVTAASIEDQEVRRRLTQTTAVKVLDEGTELLVALSDREFRRHENEHSAIDYSVIDHADIPAGCTRLERIRIGPRLSKTINIESEHGGLWIRQRGVDRTELVCSGVWLPEGFEPEVANSLNHACTLLSERYEKHRISHTMNVYKHVFFREKGDPNSRWHPIEALRSGVIAGVERGILKEAWRKLEEQLGFRPIAPVDAKQRRRGR